MAHTIVSRERIAPTELLLVRAGRAGDFLLFGVVDRVFVPGQVVWSRKLNVAGLPRARVDLRAPMRAILRVCHSGNQSCITVASAQAMGLPVSLTFVLLEESRCLEPKRTSLVGAREGSPIRV